MACHCANLLLYLSKIRHDVAASRVASASIKIFTVCCPKSMDPLRGICTRFSISVWILCRDIQLIASTKIAFDCVIHCIYHSTLMTLGWCYQLQRLFAASRYPHISCVLGSRDMQRWEITPISLVQFVSVPIMSPHICSNQLTEYGLSSAATKNVWTY